MAGSGQRFVNQSFKIPKPLIIIGNKPMFYYAAKSLPKFRSMIELLLGKEAYSHIRGNLAIADVESYAPNTPTASCAAQCCLLREEEGPGPVAQMVSLLRGAARGVADGQRR